MGNLVIADYWTCDDCISPHYGMCLQCGACGREFKNGFMTNFDKYPSSESDD